MRILALEPYYGGSHRAFLDGWAARSRHAFDILGLPARKWKWRMRHAAITLAEEVRARQAAGARWDLLFCSDMLSLAEFLGLAPAPVRDLPAVAYFHENQLTYPVRCEREWDYQFVLTNLTTALAATEVWFNSAWHRDAFLDALPGFLKPMADFVPLQAPDQIRPRSRVHPPGIEPLPPAAPRTPGPLRILWSARWEHDKNPEEFFEALALLADRGIPFRLGVIGQEFRDRPAVFETARQRFADRIDHWGYKADRQAYGEVLAWADVVVSTAMFETFGIGVLEAVSAGAFPLLPPRLAYPEIFGPSAPEGSADFFYEPGAASLARRLAELADRADRGDLWNGDPRRGVRIAARYGWNVLTGPMDDALERLNGGGR